jgi:hypothetical protein
MVQDRFHGRVKGSHRACEWPGCNEAGEFRAPGAKASGFDGPGNFRWFCLEHIRAFNAGYDYFEGMSPEEIWAAQSPIHGWEQEARAFRPTAGIDSAPRWADFSDPLDAISQRARRAKEAMRPMAWPDGRMVSPDEKRALDTMGLGVDASRRNCGCAIPISSTVITRTATAATGGTESKLQQVVEAYQMLRKLPGMA